MTSLDAEPAAAVVAPPLRRVLDASARRTLSAAVARIVLDAPTDLAARVEDRIATLAPHKIDEVRAGLRLFGSAAVALVSVRRPTPFHALTPALQDQLLAAWGASVLPQARTLFQVLRRLTLVTHYADPSTHAIIGYRGPLHTREPAVAWEGPLRLLVPSGDTRALDRSTGVGGHTGRDGNTEGAEDAEGAEGSARNGEADTPCAVQIVDGTATATATAPYNASNAADRITFPQNSSRAIASDAQRTDPSATSASSAPSALPPVARSTNGSSQRDVASAEHSTVARSTNGRSSGIITAANFAQSSTVKADVIVIGSGAGGAVAAARLAEAGKEVVILEAGEFVRSDEFTEREAEMTERLYAEGGLRATDDLAVSMLQGATVGGSTTVNWMIMLRTPAHVLEEWTRRFGLEGMDAASLAPVFARIEREVHSARVPDDAHSPNNALLIRGAQQLGWAVEPAYINARGCVRSGFCGQGCRYDAKQGTQQTYLPRALAHGARLYANTRADRIDVIGTGAHTTKRVTATVRAPGTSTAQTLTLEAPIVIIAGGAVETPLLLQRSRMGGGGVGKYLRLHPTTAVIGIHDREIYGATGIPLSTMCDEFIRRDANGYGFWLECPPLHPSVGASALSGFGASHAAMMRQFPNLASTIALTRDGSDQQVSTGEVQLDARGRARIAYRLGRNDAANVRASITAAARLQLAAGAREVHTLHTTPVVIRSERDLSQIETRSVAANRLTLFSAHVNGTARMGTDPATSGVTPDGERHGVRGVYVFDGSMLPTGVGVNPQETIMALSSVLTERLLSRLS